MLWWRGECKIWSVLDYFMVVPDCYARLKSDDRFHVWFVGIVGTLWLLVIDAAWAWLSVGLTAGVLLSGGSDASHPKYDPELHRRVHFSKQVAGAACWAGGLLATLSGWEPTVWNWVGLALCSLLSTFFASILALDLVRPEWRNGHVRYFKPLPERPRRGMVGAS